MTETRDLRSIAQPPREPFFWARLYGRSLSWPITRLVLRTPLSAGTVTVLSILIGAAGGLCFVASSPAWNIAAVALLLLSWLLDCVDGEVARVRGTASLDGEFIDACRHQIVAPAIFAGLALGVHARHPESFWLLAMGFSSAVLSLRFVGGMVDQMVLEGVRRVIRSRRPPGTQPSVKMTIADATPQSANTYVGARCQAPCSDITTDERGPYAASIQSAADADATADGPSTYAAKPPRPRSPAMLIRPLFVDFNIMHVLIAAVIADLIGLRTGRYTPLDLVHVAYGVAFPVVKLGSMALAWRRGVSSRVEEILRGADADVPHH